METIEIELTDEALIYYALAAHKADVTLNQYIADLLEKYLAGVEDA